MINDANLFHPDLRLIILLLLNLDCLIIHPNLNIHNQINHNNSYKLRFFYADVLTDFKTRINCFALFNNRIIEGNVYHFNFLEDFNHTFSICVQ